MSHPESDTAGEPLMHAQSKVQLFAHYLALHKGRDPDQPRSLTKITRTR